MDANSLLRESLETRRLLLRRPTQGDVPVIYGIHSDPRAWEHNPADALSSVQDAVVLFRRWDAHWDSRGYGYFSVDMRETRNTIGFCGFKLVSFRESQVLNLFYRFDPAAWGQGFATEAAAVVVEYADRALPTLPIVARVNPENAASSRIVTKLGLVIQPALTEMGEDGPDYIYARRWPPS